MSSGRAGDPASDSPRLVRSLPNGLDARFLGTALRPRCETGVRAK